MYMYTCIIKYTDNWNNREKKGLFLRDMYVTIGIFGKDALFVSLKNLADGLCMFECLLFLLWLPTTCLSTCTFVCTCRHTCIIINFYIAFLWLIRDSLYVTCTPLLSWSTLYGWLIVYSTSCVYTLMWLTGYMWHRDTAGLSFVYEEHTHTHWHRHLSTF